MKTVFVLRTEGVGSDRLISLHKSHNDVAADENQTLDDTVGRND